MATREEALPYYKWFWQHWRANRDVQRKLNYVDRGLYRELLDEAWAEGSLPSEIDALADICGCPVEVMIDSWKRISAHWELRDGRLYNDKLDAQRTEKDALRVSRIQTGRIGGLVKTIHKLEAIGADPQEIERVKQAEIEARDVLAGAKQQLVDADYLLDSSKQALAIASEPQANASPLLAVASGCHIEEKRREEKRRVTTSSEASSEPSPVFLELPAVGQIPTFAVSEDLIAQCEGLYPAVNVRQEIRNIRGWLDGNPTRRKTHRGMPKFIHAWMSRTQDGGKYGAQPVSAGGRGAPSPSTERVMSGVNAFRKAAADFGTSRADGADGRQISLSGHERSGPELPFRLHAPDGEIRAPSGKDGSAQLAN